MSASTTPPFIHYGNWDAQTRAHPCMKWMEDYVTQIIDQRKWDVPYNEWNTEDFCLVKPDGSSVTSGGADAWKEVANIYAPFTAHLHRGIFSVCAETEYGWFLIGQAQFCANLVGQPASGEKKVKDSDGNEWDLIIPGAYKFEYVKDEKGGIKLRKAENTMDTWPAVRGLLKRGIMKIEGGELLPQHG